MNEIAARNRRIKKILSATFGADKVKVHGNRGTAYGWVSIKIDWTPLDIERSNDMHGLVMQLLKSNGIKFSQYWPDDNSNSARDEVQLSFNQARYVRTIKHQDGTIWVQRDAFTHEWEKA